MTYGEIIVSVLIVALILFSTWRAGQTNPVGTGKLARRLTEVEGRVVDIDRRVGGVEDSVKLLAENVSATNSAIATMRLEMAGDRGVSERTWSAVDRLQNYFIDQALEQAFTSERRP